MKKLLFVVSIHVLFYLQGQAQDSHPLDSLVNKKGHSLIEGKPWLRCAAGVIYEGKSQTYHFGSSNETIFEIASITKTFFSLILAHAILEHRVKPDDDIRAYLDGHFDNLQYGGHPVTLIQLVTLTSSLPDNFPPSSDFFLELHKAKLDTLPGLVTRHSNVAAVLLGRILQNIYKKSYATLLKDYITGPLHMEHTLFDIPADQQTNFPNGYNGAGNITPYISREASTAGGLHSTVADMTKYLRYQLDENDPAVKMTHQVRWGDVNEFAIGMNWFLGKTGDGKRVLRDDGSTHGFTSYLLLYPDDHFGVVLLMNENDSVSSNRLGDMAGAIFNETHYTAAERASDGFGFSPSVNQFLKEVHQHGFDHAQEVYDALKSKNPGFEIREGEMNNWGYFLLSKEKKREALNIFKLNVALHPESWNVYDSYGETLLAMGYREDAIKMCKKSVALNPGNENGKKVLMEANR